MKVTKVFKGYQVFKASKATILEEMGADSFVMPYKTLKEAKKAYDYIDAAPDLDDIYKPPKRAKLTITYEVED